MTPEVKVLLDAACSIYFSANGTWGQLHIVCDDGNVEDEHVDFCVSEAILAGDGLAEFIGGALRAMTVEERVDYILRNDDMSDDVGDFTHQWRLADGVVTEYWHA